MICSPQSNPIEKALSLLGPPSKGRRVPVLSSFERRPGSVRHFSKASRLIKSADFRFSEPKRWRVDGFLFVYSLSGRGRIGISISKKVLRRANARNRVRRLLKEAFRLSLFPQSGPQTGIDIHVVGQKRLAEIWRSLTLADVSAHFSKFAGGVLPAGMKRTVPVEETGGV